MLSVQELNTAQLAVQCREAMRHHRPLARTEDACFELFARALRTQDEEAWAALWVQYRQLVYFWVGPDRSDAEDLLQELFWHFWQRYKGEELDNHFPDLPHVLRYLQRSAHNAAISADRRTAHEVLVADVDDPGGMRSPEVDALDHLAATEVQTLLAACIHTPDERLVMTLSFEVGLKPRQIQQAHPAQFPTVRAVSLIKERVLTRLRHTLAVTTADPLDLL